MKRAFRFGAVLLALALAGAESPDAICSSEGPSLPRPLLPTGDRDLIGASEPYLVLEPDEAPILRERVAPRYPSLPLAALREGWVSFQLVIDRDGDVEVIAIDERGILVAFDGAEALELPRRAALMRRSAGERQVVIGVVDIVDRR